MYMSIKHIPFLEKYVCHLFWKHSNAEACLIEEEGQCDTESLFTEVDRNCLVPFLTQTILKLQCDL